MHSVVAIVFENEVKMNEGKEALLRLEAEGEIIIHGYAVVAKYSDGTATVSYEKSHRPFFAFSEPSRGESAQRGASISRFARVPEGWDNSRLSDGFSDDVKKVMLPNRVALVADIEEQLEFAVDAKMEAIGGTVFRWPVNNYV